jgi:asparagine synthetase B (glutamine-hydrolysing)
MERQATPMVEELTHRGSDDGGTGIDSGEGVASSHHRLPNTDISENGHQPI